MDSFAQVFSMVKDRLQQELSEVAFQCWIHAVEPVKLENNHAYIEAPSPFQKNILQNQYEARIKKLLEEILGFPVVLSILAPEESEDDAALPKDADHASLGYIPSAEEGIPASPTDNHWSHLQSAVEGYPASPVSQGPTLPPPSAAQMETTAGFSPPSVPMGSPGSAGVASGASAAPSALDLPVTPENLTDSIKNGNYAYTFDTFIVGSSNNFAYAACKAVAQNVSTPYNPLFIYGPSGLGKTHLLHAIKHEFLKHNNGAKIIFINSEAFINEFIAAIGSRQFPEFHEKYRNADVLLVDDIQFIAGKERMQEEFFHTFNQLHELGKQIVLTSDRPPKDIKTLEDRLKTRFEWGLLTDIGIPDIETRVAIIKRKADLLNISIPDDVALYIADKLKFNIRQLEGAVKKIKAYKYYSGANPSIALAQTAVREILSDNLPEPITVQKIIEEVASTYSISPEDIRSNKRAANISMARQIAIYVTREITQMSQAAIGAEFGGRDHATIVYALKKVNKICETDHHTKSIISDIIKNIQAI